MSKPYSENGPYFMGTQFVWWQGVVEDVADPLKIGRCRVRIVGFHNPDTKSIPIEDLPWASVVQPVTSAALSEVGNSPTGLLPGSWVVGFFRDPGFFQEPIILGSIAGIPLAQNVAIGDGFKDPSGKYPLEDHLEESDLSRLARNEKIDETIVKSKKDKVVKNINTAIVKEKWNEPETPYAAEYPKNHVMQTESGHIQEFDDTPNKERIHTYHKTGTFQEIHPDGSVVNKIVAKKYEIVYNENRILIKGKKSENVEKDSDLKVGGNLNIEIEGDANMHVKGNYYLRVDGDYGISIGGQGSCNSNSGNLTFAAKRIDLNPSGVSPGDIGSPF
jgi:hypothetical protein